MEKIAIFITTLLFSITLTTHAQKLQTFKGAASYYSSRMHGHMTASGEKYDKEAYTCAHRTLPFGTILRVTNLRNDSVVLVKVNDRGPYGRGRVIDLSTAAARRLDILQHGVAQVKVEVLPSELEIWLERQQFGMSDLPDYLKAFQLDPPSVRMELQWPDDWVPQQSKKNATNKQKQNTTTKQTPVRKTDAKSPTEKEQPSKQK